MHSGPVIVEKQPLILVPNQGCCNHARNEGGRIIIVDFISGHPTYWTCGGSPQWKHHFPLPIPTSGVYNWHSIGCHMDTQWISTGDPLQLARWRDRVLDCVVRIGLLTFINLRVENNSTTIQCRGHLSSSESQTSGMVKLLLQGVWKL
jgi:hypothetical protein